jgi:site-specific DNA-methyltransferase (adenine-specific)
MKIHKIKINHIEINIEQDDDGLFIFPKHLEGGTSIKPAHEPIVMARKPFKGDVCSNVLEHGTGAINIDACRIGDEEITVNKLEEWTGFGELKNPDYTSEKHTGRWPANFIHDGSQEVIDNFPNTGSSTPSEKNKNGGEFPEDNTIKLGLKEIRRTGFEDSGSAARYFYCAKASKKDRNEGCEELDEKQYSFDGRNTPIENAYQRNNSVSNNFHPTVKPTDLMRYLCRLITPKNGTVLDPFMGSGSTGKAALLENFKFIGIELSEEYLNIASKRLKHAITNNE